MGASSFRDVIIGAAGLVARPFVRPRQPTGPPRSILVVKPCCLGDVLMSTPVLAVLRRAFPNARIDYAVGEWSAPALANNQRLNGRVDCQMVGSGRRYPPGQFMALARRIQRGNYDWCLTLERSAITGVAPWLAGVPCRAGLDSQGRGFAHTVRAPVIPGRHEAEAYLDVVRALGVPVDDPRLEYFPTEAERAYAARRLPEGENWVAIHPGGGTNPGMTLVSKRWPIQRFAGLASRIIGAGRRVVLVGAAYDAPLANSVAAGLETGDGQLINLAGQTTLGELAAVLERCVAFVGNDTGAMHLAVAVGTPALALFGPTDPQMYGPYHLGEAITAGLDCSPCFLDGRAPNCQHQNCMEAITVEQAWAALLRVIDGKGAIK